YQYQPLPTPSNTRATRIFIAGEPTSPSSMAGALIAARERLFFGLGVPSKLIRIIVLQNSSRPNRPLLPTGRHCLQSNPFPNHLSEVRSFETDSRSPPALRTPAAALPAVPEPSTNRPRPKSSRCVRPPRWRERNQTSSEFRGR